MKRLSLKVIREKCTDCICDSLSPGTETQQIEDCTDSACALWDYRPLTSKTQALNKEKRIKAMSPIERQAYEIKAEKSRLNMQKMRDKA